MTLAEAIESAVRGYLYRALSDTGGSVSKAARRAGVSRQTFYRYLKRVGVAGAPGAYGRAGEWAHFLRLGGPPHAP